MTPPNTQNVIGENNDEVEKAKKYHQKILNEFQNIVYLPSNGHKNTQKYIDAGLLVHHGTRSRHMTDYLHVSRDSIGYDTG